MGKSGEKPRVKTRLLDQAVSLFVNNKIFDGWTSASVGFNLNSIAGSFSLDIVDKFLQDKTPWLIKPGQLIHLHIGDDPVFTGFIDSVDSSFAPGGRRIIYAGRTKAGDLVDCGHKGANEFKNISLLNLITELVKPFGITVSNLTDTGKDFAKFTIKPSEKVFTAIDRASKLRGVLVISTSNGNLQIVRTGQNSSSTILEQGKNIKTGGMKLDNKGRFSEYIVKSQSVGLDNFFGEDAAQPEGVATDEGITRFRPMIMIAEGGGDGEQAKERATWEASIRAAKGSRFTVQVQGWRQDNGLLWRINEKIRIKSTFLGTNQRFLSEAVKFNKTNNGTTTNITLVREDAYAQVPVKADKDPLSFLKGFDVNA